MSILNQAPRKPKLLLLAAATLISGVAAAGNGYLQHNLVSDGSVSADHTDPNLVNAWGLAFNPTAVVWVANNGTGTSTLYDGNGNASPLVVQIPNGAGKPSSPTGMVYNGSSGFTLSQGAASGPARFIFATEDGTVAAWVPAVQAQQTLTARDDSAGNSVYKGLAISAAGSGAQLYVTDFHNNRILVLDSSFNPVPLPPGRFVDSWVPAGFAPFGIQGINGDLYVSYAKQDAARHDEIDGRGLGYIAVYDPNGVLIRHLVSGGHLNAPWGMALAPASFGRYGGRLLIGNFGDGLINAYDLVSGQYVGHLSAPDHKAISIDGLWGLAFGNGYSSQPVDTLFFSAGPMQESHGLYGSLKVAPGDDGDTDHDQDD